MKKTLPLLLLALSALVACKGREGSHAERAYTVEGTFNVDSTVVLDHLVLYSLYIQVLLEDSTNYTCAPMAVSCVDSMPRAMPKSP